MPSFEEESGPLPPWKLSLGCDSWSVAVRHWRAGGVLIAGPVHHPVVLAHHAERLEHVGCKALRIRSEMAICSEPQFVQLAPQLKCSILDAACPWRTRIHGHLVA
jgi:hypothetical protein